MQEQTRLAYLDALGLTSFVSRRALPGAAPIRRMSPPCPAPVNARRPAPVPSVAGPTAETVESRPVAERIPAMPRIPQCRFRLAVVAAGAWLWLEDLGELPLATEQVRLMTAMAHALQLASTTAGENLPGQSRPAHFEFHWPMHQNSQLDNGEDAARA